jgi:hypothetical protein
VAASGDGAAALPCPNLCNKFRFFGQSTGNTPAGRNGPAPLRLFLDAPPAIGASIPLRVY